MPSTILTNDAMAKTEVTLVECLRTRIMKVGAWRIYAKCRHAGNSKKFKGNSILSYVFVTRTNEIQTFHMQTIECHLNFIEFPWISLNFLHFMKIEGLRRHVGPRSPMVPSDLVTPVCAWRIYAKCRNAGNSMKFKEIQGNSKEIQYFRM